MAEKKKSGKKNTIMVVDDNSDLVEIVRITLEGKGFKVRCAYSGRSSSPAWKRKSRILFF